MIIALPLTPNPTPTLDLRVKAEQELLLHKYIYMCFCIWSTQEEIPFRHLNTWCSFSLYTILL